MKYECIEHFNFQMDEENIPLLINEKQTVAQSTQEVRMAFVRKVYGLLTIQLILMDLVSLIMYFVEPVRTLLLQNLWFFTLTSISSIILLIFLFINRLKSPVNLIILFAFTVCMSFNIGIVVVSTELDVILKAGIITTIAFIGLTIFTLQSKWNFSGLAPFLFSGLMLLVLTSFISMFFPYSSVMQFVLGVAGTVIFSGYILFDTYNIFNTLSPDEYIIGTVSLYLDLVNLFLSIVNLLDSGKR